MGITQGHLQGAKAWSMAKPKGSRPLTAMNLRLPNNAVWSFRICPDPSFFARTQGHHHSPTSHPQVINPATGWIACTARHRRFAAPQVAPGNPQDPPKESPSPALHSGLAEDWQLPESKQGQAKGHIPEDCQSCRVVNHHQISQFSQWSIGYGWKVGSKKGPETA